MTVTPQTNATLEEIAEAILKVDSLCICGHVSPDGDCVGSALALRAALLSLGKEVDVLLADDKSELDSKFLFLPGACDYIHALDYKGKPEMFIAVDVPNADRLGHSASCIQAKAGITVTLDHHAAPKRMSDLSYTDPDAASCTCIIWKLIKHFDITIDKDMATCALSGLMTDTGSFQYQNVDEEAFVAASEMVRAQASPDVISNNFFQSRSLASIHLEALTIEHMELLCDGKVCISWVSMSDLKKCGATKADCETLINTIRSVAGVQIACMLREQKDGVRGSLRAKGDEDVAAIAKEFNGGGHRAAAGFTLHSTLGDALDAMRNHLKALYE